MNQQRGSEPEIQDESDGLDQDTLLAQAKTLSHEQLNLLLHETRRLIKQLGYVMADPRASYPQVFKKSSDMVKRVDALREALILEQVRRQFEYLQAMISAPTSCDKDAMPMMADLLGIADSLSESEESHDSPTHAAEEAS